MAHSPQWLTKVSRLGWRVIQRWKSFEIFSMSSDIESSRQQKVFVDSIPRCDGGLASPSKTCLASGAGIPGPLLWLQPRLSVFLTSIYTGSLVWPHYRTLGLKRVFSSSLIPKSELLRFLDIFFLYGQDSFVSKQKPLDGNDFRDFFQF